MTYQVCDTSFQRSLRRGGCGRSVSFPRRDVRKVCICCQLTRKRSTGYLVSLLSRQIVIAPGSLQFRIRFLFGTSSIRIADVDFPEAPGPVVDFSLRLRVWSKVEILALQKVDCLSSPAGHRCVDVPDALPPEKVEALAQKLAPDSLSSVSRMNHEPFYPLCEMDEMNRGG